jgi:hypothetical protein
LFLEDVTEYLGDPPPPYDDGDAAWSWTAIKAPLPFDNARIAYYALHPDNRTLFVSAWGGTFSFDAERLEWTHRGDWMLPFDGQAYYDAQLEAWVGLYRKRDKAGRLCSCDVPAGAGKLTHPPSWKLCKDKLFGKDSALHRGATLVYMGDRKFCLVESMFHKDDQHLHRDPVTVDDFFDVRYSRRRRRVLRMTTFGLAYIKAGELQIVLRQGHTPMTFKRPHDSRSDLWSLWHSGSEFKTK